MPACVVSRRIFFTMKIALFFISVCSTISIFGAVAVMPRVDAKLFVNQGRTDFEAIFVSDKEKVKSAVEWLFDNNKLDHDFSKAVDPSLPFGPYWNHFSEMWNLVDLDADGKHELLFSGHSIISDEKESLTVFVQYGTVWKQVFWDDGHLLAFKIHPRTGEVILYHHRYPCCSQFTHMVQRMRWLRNKMQLKQSYFLARDTGMKGQFFPKKTLFPRKYRQLKQTTMLYWSKGVIQKDAAIFSPTNAIIHFPAKSYYKVLFQQGKWKYVLMVSPPKMEESMVANPSNLQSSFFFGWMKI